MNKMTLRKAVLYGVGVAFILGLVLFVYRYLNHAESWAFFQTNRHAYTNGELTEMGTIKDRTGDVLAYTKDGKRCYHEDALVRMATVHAVGDSKGYISTGAQNALKDWLTGYNKLNGFYTYDGSGNDMQLTIDADTSVAAVKALGKFAGCVGVCNYKTGEMICMVSTPTFDVGDMDSVKKAESGELGSVYVNRFLSSLYTPGSTFKIVTASAVIDTLGEKAYDESYFCRYGTMIEDETLSCVGRHGDVQLKRAFSHSCNAYFSQTALSIGKNNMSRFADAFGFNKTFYLDGIACATSSYQVSEARNIDFGWSGIGQYTDQINPFQYLCDICAIARDGSYVQPYFVSRVTDSNGYPVHTAKTSEKRVLTKETAKRVAELMDYAVSDNYGKSTFGTLDVCGKTGTAEVGEGVENSLFVGFCKDEDLPLAFVVVVEGGGSGRSSALTVANKTLQAAKKSFAR